MHYEAAGLYAWPVNTITKRTKRTKCNRGNLLLPLLSLLKKKREEEDFRKHLPMSGHQFVPDFCVFLYIN